MGRLHLLLLPPSQQFSHGQRPGMIDEPTDQLN
jgi:hypothetical protein